MQLQALWSLRLTSLLRTDNSSKDLLSLSLAPESPGIISYWFTPITVAKETEYTELLGLVTFPPWNGVVGMQLLAVLCAPRRFRVEQGWFCIEILKYTGAKQTKMAYTLIVQSKEPITVQLDTVLCII